MIPFTSEVYLGLIARYNAAIWPAQIVALVLGLFVLWQAARPRSAAGRAGADRIIPWFLAAAWLWTAVAFPVVTLALPFSGSSDLPVFPLSFASPSRFWVGSTRRSSIRSPTTRWTRP